MNLLCERKRNLNSLRTQRFFLFVSLSVVERGKVARPPREKKHPPYFRALELTGGGQRGSGPLSSLKTEEEVIPAGVAAATANDATAEEFTVVVAWERDQRKGCVALESPSVKLDGGRFERPSPHQVDSPTILTGVIGHGKVPNPLAIVVERVASTTLATSLGRLKKISLPESESFPAGEGPAGNGEVPDTLATLASSVASTASTLAASSGRF